MSDEFKAPEESPAAAAAGKLKLDGGSKPRDPMVVFNQMAEAFKANLVGWFLAGLAYFAVIFGVVIVSIGAIGISVAPGVVTEDENLLVFGLLGGMAVYMGLLLVFSMGVAPLMNAAMIRGLDAERRGEGPIGFATPFTGLTTNAGRIVLFNLMGQVIVLIGMMMLYVPGLIAMAVITFALPIVVLEEETSPMDALTRAWQGMVADPVWHLAQFALLFAALLIAELTVVGIFFLVPLMTAHQAFAYRELHAPPT